MAQIYRLVYLFYIFVSLIFIAANIQTMAKAERTRQFIIEKAAPIFNTKGYAGTSIADVMNATGLSKGCIYGNFVNKDEIALAAFDYNCGRHMAYLKNRVMLSENSLESLLVYPQTFCSFLTLSFLHIGGSAEDTGSQTDDTHHLLRKKAASALISWRKTLENQIIQGIEKKEIKPQTNPTEIAVIMISMIEGAIVQKKVSGKTTEIKIAMSFLEKLIRNLKA